MRFAVCQSRAAIGSPRIQTRLDAFARHSAAVCPDAVNAQAGYAALQLFHSP
jgi:hypothetical protein